MTKTDTTMSARPPITMQQLFQIGLTDIAYVKAVSGGKGGSYALHSADGNEIARFADREVAFAACRQHDLEPVSVH